MARKFKLLTLLIGLLITTTTLASPTQRGVYLEATFGTVYYNEMLIGNFIRSGGFATNLNIGYQLDNYFTVETGASEYTMEGDNVSSVHIAAKAMVPFSDRFNIFVKLGPGLAGKSAFKSVAGLFYAIGASLAIGTQLDLTVQTSGVSEFFETVGMFSAGLTYHFA